jgi:hypothetical protein
VNWSCPGANLGVPQVKNFKIFAVPEWPQKIYCAVDRSGVLASCSARRSRRCDDGDAGVIGVPFRLAAVNLLSVGGVTNLAFGW